MQKDLSKTSGKKDNLCGNRRRVWQTCLTVLALWSAGIPVWGSEWVEDTFADFRDGDFLDAGSNMYVSASGRLQIISQWDLNKDGKVDLVLPSGHAHTEKENTYIYLNEDGEVNARSRIDLPGGGSSSGFIADLNRDGLNDLVVSNASDSHVKEVDAWIYWGTKNGFNAHQRTELPAFEARSICSGDFNGDGWDDLAIACQWKDSEGTIKNPVSLIYWNSDEGFKEESRLALPLGGEAALSVLSTHLDADGKDDLLIKTNTSLHLFASKRGAFSTGEASTMLDIAGNNMTEGDFDNDGIRELVIGGGDRVVIIKRKGEEFDLSDKQELKVSVASGLATADIDADGNDDLIVAVQHTPGGAQWTNSLVFISKGGQFSQDEVQKLPTLGACAVSAADLNGDDLPELVFSNASVTYQNCLYSYIFWNAGGKYFFGNHSQLPTQGTIFNAIGDIDNDQDLDVVFFQDEGGFRDGPSRTDIYYGNGTRKFTEHPDLSFLSHQIFGIGQADLDDDGFVDLVLTRENFISDIEHEQSGITIHWGSERGFQRTSEITSESSYGGVRIADINKDGYLDMLTGGVSFDPANPDQKGIPIYWGSKNGFRRMDRSVVPSKRDKTRGPLLADLDKDGWLDMVAQEEDGFFTIWKGSNNGFSDENRTEYELDQPVQLMYFQAADFNRDGWLDLLLPQRGPADGTQAWSWIYYGSKNGFSREHSTTVPSYVAYQNTVADFDKDGWLDMALMAYGGEVRGNRPSLIHWGSQNGFGKRPYQELPTYGSSGSVSLDFDGDGWLDLFFANHRQSGSTTDPIPHRHKTVSMLYWGGAEGFTANSRLDIPSQGPSGLNLRNPGNTYDRGCYEDYVSSVHRIPGKESPKAIDWSAETPVGTSIAIQIRCAELEAELKNSAWQGPSGKDSWWTRPSVLGKKIPAGKFLQYRIRLISGNAGNTPIVDRVMISFE